MKLNTNHLRSPSYGAAAPELSPGIRKLLDIRRTCRLQNLRWMLAMGGMVAAYVLSRALGI